MRLGIILCISLSCALFGDGISEARLYKDHSNLQWEWALEAIEDYPFSGDERILDLGCGDGRITAELSKNAPNGSVVGVDLSKEMVRFASNRFAPNHYRNLYFMVGDATSLPFFQQFDLIFSSCALHWAVDQKKALQNIFESLTPGGIALLVVPGASPSNLATLSKNVTLRNKWADYFPEFPPQRVYFMPEEYSKLLTEVGFTVQTLTENQYSMILEDRTALKNWLQPLVNFTEHLPPELQHEFLEDLTDEMLKLSPDATSPHIPNLMIKVVAVKS